MTLDPETTEPHARNAARNDKSGETHASQSISTSRASGGIAGTVVGTAASSTPHLSAPAAIWVQESRRISPVTLERLGAASGTAFFPDVGRNLSAIFFRYDKGGWKARSFPDKRFVSSKGFKLAFWNLRRVLNAAPKRVYITEGEFDAAALIEAGISPDQVLSVPNGAKDKAADDPAEMRGYEFVREALSAGLNKVREIVWCGDSDSPGLVLRSDMVRLLGAARFSFVEWPEGCKDANDVLRHEGPAFLKDFVENGCMPWPVSGLYRMSELPEPAPLTLWNPGFPEWENKIRLAARNMSVVTGHPGHGKTAMWTQIWFQIVRAYDVPMCVASFETRPKPHYRRQLRTLIGGRLEREMNDAEIARADKWINDRYLFVVHPDQRPTLEWFLEMAEVAVIRHGVRIIQIDPWNRLEGQRDPRESETDYIGRCLRTMHAFAHDMNCHVQILAHPAKMDGNRRGQPPSLEDINGSKNWENMIDQGFVVHRPEIFDGTNVKTEAALYHRKARFEELGHPCKVMLDFDLRRGIYRPTDYD